MSLDCHEKGVIGLSYIDQIFDESTPQAYAPLALPAAEPSESRVLFAFTASPGAFSPSNRLRRYMLDHVFLTVSDIKRSVSFYEAALAPLGINQRFDYDGKNGPLGHPDLKGFGANGRFCLWLRQGVANGHAAHVGFVANTQKQVDAAYAAAIAAGATDKGAPGIRLYYDPRYYAANVADPDGYSLEFVYKSWQHP